VTTGFRLKFNRYVPVVESSALGSYGEQTDYRYALKIIGCEGLLLHPSTAKTRAEASYLPGQSSHIHRSTHRDYTTPYKKTMGNMV
jgi:hypothetical protein